ncbi:hypothetical protein AAE478_010574 [Parahypoxylon ruwenzoriense]
MDSQGRSITSLQSLTLDLPPSCIEFCPAHTDYFVVGTYNLQKQEEPDAEAPVGDDEGEQQIKKKAQTRNGSLVVFRLTDAADIKHIQTVPYPSAILDLHFHPRREKGTVVAVVSSTGALSFFNLSISGESLISLNEIITHKPLGDDGEVLFLSCSWHPNIPDLLAITTSNYQVHILRVDESWNAYKTHTEPVLTHSLEAWTVAFSPFLAESTPEATDSSDEERQLFTIFSGGDDSKLLSTSCAYQSVRDDDEGGIIEIPFPKIAVRGHEAGVTAILPLKLQLADRAFVVVTGSYDDHIRVYAIPGSNPGASSQKPRVLAEQNLNGGVWRLKLIKLEEGEVTNDKRRWRTLLLASCMHAGSRVLEVIGDYTKSCEIKVLGRFEEHKSMNYGSDFQPRSELGGQSLRCVSTSFYDRLLCLWEY